MCSIGEDDYGDEGGLHAMIPTVEALTLNAATDCVCNKCGQTGATYKLRYRSVECRECFLTYVRHKFRATLGSSKILPRDANVLLVFDGSAESMVLLDMLDHAQTENKFKRLHCTATALYVDELALQQKTDDEQQAHILSIRDFLAPYEHFEAYILPIAASTKTLYNLKNLKSYFERRTIAEERAFIDRVNAMRTLTARQDYIKHYRNRVFAHAAAHFKCGFVFRADTSNALATDLLAAVALGRGSSAALDVSLVDNRLGAGITMVRPLKDLNAAEVELFIRARQLQPLNVPGEAGTSLQNLTKEFVDNLQRNFQSTVSTVFRTGDKIAVNRIHAPPTQTINVKDEEASPVICAFCNSPLDYADSTTLLAIEFSRLVSETGARQKECEELDLGARRNLHGTNDQQLRNLCHACRNIRDECRDKEFI